MTESVAVETHATTNNTTQKVRDTGNELLAAFEQFLSNEKKTSSIFITLYIACDMKKKI